MTDTLLAMLVGAGIVAGAGFVRDIGQAIADRIRENRQARKTERARARTRAEAEESTPAPALAPRGTLGGEVVRALVTSGYSKEAANAAMNAAPYTARSTLESWTRAALKACARKDNAS